MCRMMSDWEVELIDDSISEFIVTFKGPKDSKDLSSDCTLCLSLLVLSTFILLRLDGA